MGRRRAVILLIPLLLLTGSAGCGQEEERHYTPLRSDGLAGGRQAQEGQDGPGGGAAGEAAGEPTGEPARRRSGGSGDAAGEPVPGSAHGFRLKFDVLPEAADHPALLRFQDFWRAWWAGVATWGKDKRYLSYLTKQSIAFGADTFPETVEGWREDGSHPTGVLRVYRLTAQRGKYATSDAVVSIRGCVDARRLGFKSVRTGEERFFGKKPNAHYQLHAVMLYREGQWFLNSYRTINTVDPEATWCR